ncbi:MAG: hypothetical protein KGM49_10270, partial [Sphingomonadales bacterium]|nr:hypothetical protein [Sphingomonadales bacterium]
MLPAIQHYTSRTSADLRARFGERVVSLALALLVELVLIIIVLSMGIAREKPVSIAGTRITAISVRAAQDDQPKNARQKQSRSVQQPAQPSTQPDRPQPPNVQPVTTPPHPVPPAIIPLSHDQMAALDISRMPHQQGQAAPAKALMGPVDSGVPGDSRRVGTAPNGQPLYAASWYREPTESELAGYLSTAEQPGYALIACRTAPEWRVEDCVGLDEYPAGSQIQRAVLAAAWQFKVRPPRLGGVYKVGEWVRIRI